MNYDINHFKSSYTLWNIQAGSIKKAVNDATYIVAMGIYNGLKNQIALTKGDFLKAGVDFLLSMGKTSRPKCDHRN